MAHLRTKKEAGKRIAKLRYEISRHRYLYHVLDRQEISDAALDSLKHELTKLETQFPDLITPDSPTQRVGGRALAKFKKVRHETPMRSLHDVANKEELAEWEKRIKKIFQTPSSPSSEAELLQRTDTLHAPLDYFAEIKIDGFAVSLIYENGILAQGATRGDGETGEDVAENLKTIESIPLRLYGKTELPNRKKIQALMKKVPRAAAANAPGRVEIRGEAYMTKKTFDAVNREQEKQGLPKFANPRNIAAGSVRQLDPKITASRGLHFIAYDIVTDVGQKTHEEEHVILKLLGFKTMELVRRCDNIEDVCRFWNRVHKKREKLPFLIDGIVVQVNSNDAFERLGVVGKGPRGAVAFKFPAEEATTRIKEILVQVGRTGVLTPVAALEPISVGGVVISRATLHNMDEVDRLDARIGDTVIVRRAGDVIPQVAKVLLGLRPSHAKKFRMPRAFCGQRVIRKKGEVAYRIPRPEECPLAQRELLYHFVSKGAFDIQGLGPKIIDQLADQALAKDAADLFFLTEQDIKPLERFAEKSAENLIAAIQSRKTIGLSRFIYALGIPHVGEETAHDLAKHFNTFRKLQNASFEELDCIPAVGAVVAKNIHEWLQKKEDRAFLKKLKKAGVRVQSSELQAPSSKLSGKTFVLTGGLTAITRSKAKERIRARGADVSESVSKKTDYVIVGSDPGSKFDQAKKLGVQTIDENEFLKLLG